VHAASETADRVVDVAAAPSWDLCIDDMVEIARTVNREIDAGSAGVVVTHGTDTMEETAWLCELLLGAARRSRATVVFTGAMRFLDDVDADGPRNLASALRRARPHDLVGSGVHVVWDGETYPARRVRKADAAGARPFRLDDHLGVVGAPPEPGEALARDVVLLKVGPVARPPIPEAAAGVVLEGTGAGHAAEPRTRASCQRATCPRRRQRSPSWSASAATPTSTPSGHGGRGCSTPGSAPGFTPDFRFRTLATKVWTWYEPSQGPARAALRGFSEIEE
jgi:L-asparaginase/Glu-tRNA(Gln) amidotransferase subunit D